MKNYLFALMISCAALQLCAQDSLIKKTYYPISLSADRVKALNTLLKKDTAIIQHNNGTMVALHISAAKTKSPSIIMQTSDTLTRWIDQKDIRLWKITNDWHSENPSENAREVEAGNVGWILRKAGIMK